VSEALPERIGPYSVVREIGRGGMGVVCLAHDDRLGRDVAIKALPEHLADDPDRLARFAAAARRQRRQGPLIGRPPATPCAAPSAAAREATGPLVRPTMLHIDRSPAMTDKEKDEMHELPAGVAALVAAYRPPSDAAFGSAVFHEQLGDDGALGEAAQRAYRRFVGALWDRFGAEAWMGPWKQVYRRPDPAARDVVAELRAVDDPDARQSVPLVLELSVDAERARAALSTVYDDPAMTEMAVYAIGDGAAMSGLVVAGRNTASGTSTCLTCLMD
jgi:hypothetical protein